MRRSEASNSVLQGVYVAHGTRREHSWFVGAASTEQACHERTEVYAFPVVAPYIHDAGPIQDTEIGWPSEAHSACPFREEGHQNGGTVIGCRCVPVDEHSRGMGPEGTLPPEAREINLKKPRV